MAKIYATSLGCKVNSYELEAIKDLLLENNHNELSSPEEADFIIVNTCCVTNMAASKSRKKISHLHKINSKAKLIVMGCYVQGFEDEIKDMEGISLLVGTSNRTKIKEYIDNPSNITSYVKDIDIKDKYEELKVTSYFENTRAYLKIQDGCDNYCTYCIIPYVRGHIKSRDEKDILDEANKLVSLGYKEIVLTGIHTGSYGKDKENNKFSDLVEKLLAIDGLYRLRISSIEESEIDDKLIYLLQHNDKLAKHLHIPLQAGSDAILKSMNRKYDLKTYINNVKKIQELVDDIAITTDVIVGFPGETDDNFNDTINTCKEIGYAKIHVFPFSRRKGTVADKLQNQIDGNIKKQRTDVLLDLSNKLGYNFNSRYLYKKIDVLIEEKLNNSYFGHTSNFIKVQIKTDKKLERNQIYEAYITKIHDTFVEGE